MTTEDSQLKAALESQVAAFLEGGVIFDSDEEEEEDDSQSPVLAPHLCVPRTEVHTDAKSSDTPWQQSASSETPDYKEPQRSSDSTSYASHEWSSWQGRAAAGASSDSRSYTNDEWNSWSQNQTAAGTNSESRSNADNEWASWNQDRNGARASSDSKANGAGEWNATSEWASNSQGYTAEAPQAEALNAWGNWQMQQQLKMNIQKGPPPPPPPGPYPEAAEPESVSLDSTTKELCDDLHGLIESHDNLLPGTAFEELYKLGDGYKEVVRAAGGPKKFVEVHKYRFVWTREGVTGGSVRLVQNSSQRPQSAHETWSAASTKPAALADGTSKKWLEELIDWQKDGYLSAAEVFTQLAAWKTAQEAASFKAEMDSYGGLEQFVASFPKSFSWERGSICKAAPPPVVGARQSPQSSHATECWEVIVKVLEQNDGAILLAKVLRQVKEFDVPNFERHRKEVDDAGGVKKYICWYPERFECALASGPGTETVYLKKKPVPQECVSTIEEMLQWHDGGLLASRLLPELHAWKPSAHAACKKEVEKAGSIKKFIGQHPDRFKWSLQDGPGTELIQSLREENVESEAVTDIVAALLEWHGGSLLSSRIFIDLKAWKPDSYEAVREEILQVGGLKKFAAIHPNRFKWEAHAQDSKDTICLVTEAQDFSAFLDALVELIEWNGGSLLASKVFKKLRDWKPVEVTSLRKEVDDAGSLKKLIMGYPDRFEWVLDSDPGKEAVQLVKAKIPEKEAAKETPKESAARSGYSQYQ